MTSDRTGPAEPDHPPHPSRRHLRDQAREMTDRPRLQGAGSGGTEGAAQSQRDPGDSESRGATDDGSSPADPFDQPGETVEQPRPRNTSSSPSSTAMANEEVVTTERQGSEAGGDEEKGSTRSFWKELPILIVVALVAAVLIKTFLVQAFYIPSASMRDTLLEGDRVMVNKLSYRFGEPGRGDVLVFDSPLEQRKRESLPAAVLRHIGEALGLSSPETALIKRVVALAGETIEVRDGRVHIDGEALNEPYLQPGTRMRDFGPESIPEGHVFVMGDNRSHSQDSRVFGPIAIDDIVGRAFLRVWPPSRWGGL